MRNRRFNYSIIIFITILLLTPTHIIHAVAPDISASSAIVMDATTGRILYEKNIHDKKPMASTTKIMTALVALEKSNLDNIVKVPRNAVGVEGSSIYLVYDEKVSMKDLLYGLMLRSGNDSAVAIATEIGGSVDGFSELMNKKAQEIGAINTNFTNPHGLHHKNHYTTAYDLALITREALKKDAFKEIVKTKLWVAKRENFKYFYNKNKTLAELNGGDGVKIGFTTAAGRCLVTSATRDGMQLICVVLNAPNWFQDSYGLINYAYEEYTAYHVFQKDQVLKNVRVINGKKVETGVISYENLTVPVKSEEADKIFTVLELEEKYSAPLKRGDKLGRAKVYADDKLIYSLNLYCREDINEKTFKDKVIQLFNK